jgi:hypothetical protein
VNRCFVIQPFDGGKFDKRYDDVLVPAIEAADLEPYRVDRDPKVSVPIDEIESGIESSRVCLADITTDNPNVWFELGYAIASTREVVLICSEERTTKFPFDVQHRTITRYTTESKRDFDKLGDAITARLKAIISTESKLKAVVQISSVAAVEGLEQHEFAALVAAAEMLTDPMGSISTNHIARDMEKAGFTQIAATLAVRSLIAKGMLHAFEDKDYDNSPYTAIRVTDNGMSWLLQNTDRLRMRRALSASASAKPSSDYDDASSVSPGFPDDEIPF